MDLFATISEVAGVSNANVHDSKSFAPLFQVSSKIREYQYSEITDDNNDGWAISNGEYKLIFDVDSTESFYHLASDAYEENNLLRGQNILTQEEQQAKSELEAELEKIWN